LTGKRIRAAEALRLGLVNEVVPRAELDGAVGRWVEDVLACAPLALRAIKQSVRRTAHLSAAEAQALRLPAVIEALGSTDAEEGVAAFREKRPPPHCRWFPIGSDGEWARWRVRLQSYLDSTAAGFGSGQVVRDSAEALRSNRPKTRRSICNLSTC